VDSTRLQRKVRIACYISRFSVPHTFHALVCLTPATRICVQVSMFCIFFGFNLPPRPTLLSSQLYLRVQQRSRHGWTRAPPCDSCIYCALLFLSHLLDWCVPSCFAPRIPHCTSEIPDAHWRSYLFLSRNVHFLVHENSSLVAHLAKYSLFSPAFRIVFMVWDKARTFKMLAL